MKRWQKHPLKHQEEGEGTPLKDSKLGALPTAVICFDWQNDQVLKLRQIRIKILKIIGQNMIRWKKKEITPQNFKLIVLAFFNIKMGKYINDRSIKKNYMAS